MNPRNRALIQVALLVSVCAALLMIFPSAFRFVEMAARELRYLWWIVLLGALAIWLIWGVGRKR